MNSKDRSISDNTEASLEEGVAKSRRDFLKKTGKFAMYTPPAMMLLMKPSYAQMNKSVVGRTCKHKNNYEHHNDGNELRRHKSSNGSRHTGSNGSRRHTGSNGSRRRNGSSGLRRHI